ncbi:hypothetical protein DPMN_045640 [Dreissena polymorpha]|uniref:HAT C-terminal dimerisation domain-containing protein n=1 Tax=Dreissena polymorpha TaxID=45954 RepID=A0A9D4D6X0_DREPO|nr:hypothetical protein DPMN_045640 [Dreissena polymorpha]
MRVICQPYGDLLIWRCENEQRFPSMWPRMLFIVPTTSVPRERMFSKTDNLVSKAHNCISHKLMDKVMFLTK